MSEENLPKDVTYLTLEGMRKLETELAHLRMDGRAEVAQRTAINSGLGETHQHRFPATHRL